MVAVGKVSMKQVQNAWRGRSALRGYHFGFNLKTLRPNEASLRDWFVEAQKAGVTGRKDIEATAYVTPLHAYVARNAPDFRVARGIQEIHWASPGSHTNATHVEAVLKDFPNIDAVLVNHSEVIAEQGRTLEQAAGQVRMALRTTVEERIIQHITLCVGEDRATYEKGTTTALRFVEDQVRTVLESAGAKAEDMGRIGIAYEPRFAIQVGNVAGIPPTDAHIKTMGWGILQTVAEVVGLEGMSEMFTLQYGGSMKGPKDEKAPVQRFVGPGNAVESDLYNGGLIGTAGADPVTAASILDKIENLITGSNGGE